MQYRIIYNHSISGYVFGLLMVVATAAMASGENYQQPSQYLPPVNVDQNGSKQYYDRQVVDGQDNNPWQLPQEPVAAPGFKRLPKYQSQPNQDNRQTGQYQDKHHRTGRFVTPEILESLKRQQMQTQMTPGSMHEYRQMPPQPMMYQPSPGGYGAPSYGMGYPDSLYNTPAVSPWGGGLDTLYRGQSFPDTAPGSFPWLPNEALGGLPPIHVPSFGESDNTDVRNPDNVFNPFNFMPDNNMK